MTSRVGELGGLLITFSTLKRWVMDAEEYPDSKVTWPTSALSSCPAPGCGRSAMSAPCRPPRRHGKDIRYCEVVPDADVADVSWGLFLFHKSIPHPLWTPTDVGNVGISA